MNITITDNLGVVLNAEVEVMTRKVVSMAIDDQADAELAYVAMAVVSGVLEAESMRKDKFLVPGSWNSGAGAAAPALRSVRPEAPTCEGGCE